MMVRILISTIICKWKTPKLMKTQVVGTAKGLDDKESGMKMSLK